MSAGSAITIRQLKRKVPSGLQLPHRWRWLRVRTRGVPARGWLPIVRRDFEVCLGSRLVRVVGVEGVDIGGTQHYCCVVIPAFNEDGNLPPGIHWATWQDLCDRFGTTPHRRELLEGLKAALESLRDAGCTTAYIDGSFVTSKDVPADFDACWDPAGVDPSRLDPILLKFDRGRAAQKAKFKGELFPSSSMAATSGPAFLAFFQVDKNSGKPKGLIAVDLRRLS